MTSSATVIADSISEEGARITSLHVYFPRIMLPEFNTHRVFSRNFRSSRAVPVAKLLEEVRNNPYEPIVWLKNQPGMQGGEPMTPEEIEVARAEWRQAAKDAADHAEKLMKLGVHKQWANRGIETYLYVHGLVTSTQWSNFFTLRNHSAAQPEMNDLAIKMRDAIAGSTPQFLKAGQWHLPYIQEEDWNAVNSAPDETGDLAVTTLLKISAARCARISYEPFDGDGSFEKELQRYKLLIENQPVHASPVEHQATPDFKYLDNEMGEMVWNNPKSHRNFVGWQQYRSFIPNETIHD